MSSLTQFWDDLTLTFCSGHEQQLEGSTCVVFFAVGKIRKNVACLPSLVCPRSSLEDVWGHFVHKKLKRGHWPFYFVSNERTQFNAFSKQREREIVTLPLILPFFLSLSLAFFLFILFSSHMSFLIRPHTLNDERDRVELLKGKREKMRDREREKVLSSCLMRKWRARECDFLSAKVSAERGERETEKGFFPLQK